jgi:hypothetical protein
VKRPERVPRSRTFHNINLDLTQSLNKTMQLTTMGSGVQTLSKQKLHQLDAIRKFSILQGRSSLGSRNLMIKVSPQHLVGDANSKYFTLGPNMTTMSENGSSIQPILSPVIGFQMFQSRHMHNT